MQTDYIMPRPQGSPSGAALLPQSLDTNQVSHDGTRALVQFQPHLCPGGHRHSRDYPQQPPPHSQGLAQRAPVPPVEPTIAKSKDTPCSEGLVATGRGRQICQPTGHLLIAPPPHFQHQNRVLLRQICSTDGPQSPVLKITAPLQRGPSHEGATHLGG